MDLVLQSSTPAPPKPVWHDRDPFTRGEWSSIYETIATWFCSSHDFNKEDNLVILYQDSLIKLEGQTIRYLGPSLRSAASLVHKAFKVLATLEDDAIEESTPGIYVYKSASSYKFSPPYSTLALGDQISPTFPTEGTLFAFSRVEAKQYYVPGSRLSQGLVWFLQTRLS